MDLHKIHFTFYSWKTKTFLPVPKCFLFFAWSGFCQAIALHRHCRCQQNGLICTINFYFSQGKHCLKIFANTTEQSNSQCKRVGSLDYRPKGIICKSFGLPLAQLYYFGLVGPDDFPQEMCKRHLTLSIQLLQLAI